MSEDYRKYLRPKQLPHVWCPGCGNGMIVRAFLQAVIELKLDQDKVVVVSGIGCSGRTPSLKLRTLNESVSIVTFSPARAARRKRTISRVRS